MDPERVRAYLQISCAGLGFEIGEVWHISENNESGSSSSPPLIEEKKHDSVSKEMNNYSNKTESKRRKRIRFLQLYTSKSYDKRRKDLLRPNGESDGKSPSFRRTSSTEDLQKHVLSPRLVDSISNTMQVVWANSDAQKGLLGRSDMLLQTAVGVPVAIDGEGNMCVVVMFSPSNIHSSDEALDYLGTICKSATASSIPCLLPVLNGGRDQLFFHKQKLLHENRHRSDQSTSHDMGAGIVARFVSFGSNLYDDQFDENGNLIQVTDNSHSSDVEVHTVHELTTAPKDCFGIPMLPKVAQLGNKNEEIYPNSSSLDSHDVAEAFDEASYGVWSTVMNNPMPKDTLNKTLPTRLREMSITDEILMSGEDIDQVSRNSSSSTLSLLGKPILLPQAKDQLEEFATAFLNMSIFDAADVWVPYSAANTFDELSHVLSIVATDCNEGLNYFKEVSKECTIKMWSGAVGRAYASGNPVWSSNKDVIVDSARKLAFSKASIKTSVAIPIFAQGSVSPSCILCCYSLIKTVSVPFVLRFLQQALRLLWGGLENIEPHESVGKELWNDVVPADLGEMAADLEMQKAFISKKRPHDSMSPANVGYQMPPDEKISHNSNISINVVSLDKTKNKKSRFVTNLFATSSSARALGPAPLLPNAVISAAVSNLDRNMVTSIEQPQLSTYQVEINQNNITQPTVYTNLNHVQQATPTSESRLPWTSNQNLSNNFDGTNRHYKGFQPSTSPSPPVSSQLDQFGDVNELTSAPLAPASSMSSLSSSQSSQPIPHKEDPYTARKNIEEFNAMARKNYVPQMSNSDQSQSLQGVGIIQYSLDSMLNSSLNPKPVLVNKPQQHLIPDSSYSNANFTPLTESSNPLLPTEGLYCVQVKPQSANAPPIQIGTSRPCRIQGCNDIAVSKRPYCAQHSGNRTCEFAGCTKCAQGATRFCIAHGGGRRCTVPGCDKGARDKFFCAAHGGGRRCTVEGCTKSAVGGSKLCTSHGGGRRCAVEGCRKSAQSSTKFCVKHGGGKKCAHESCSKVARGRTLFCAAHGGGVRCQLEGCNRVAIGKKQLCRAHGGGATSKTKRKNKALPIHTSNILQTPHATTIQQSYVPTNTSSMMF